MKSSNTCALCTFSCYNKMTLLKLIYGGMYLFRLTVGEGYSVGPGRHKSSQAEQETKRPIFHKKHKTESELQVRQNYTISKPTTSDIFSLARFHLPRNSIISPKSIATGDYFFLDTYNTESFFS